MDSGRAGRERAPRDSGFPACHSARRSPRKRNRAARVSPLRLEAQATRKPHPSSTPPRAPPGVRLRTPRIKASTAAKQVKPQLRARAPGQAPLVRLQGGPLRESRAPNKYPRPGQAPEGASQARPPKERLRSGPQKRPWRESRAPRQKPPRAGPSEERRWPGVRKTAAREPRTRQAPQAEPSEERPWPDPHQGRRAKVAHQDKRPGSGPQGRPLRESRAPDKYPRPGPRKERPGPGPSKRTSLVRPSGTAAAREPGSGTNTPGQTPGRLLWERRALGRASMARFRECRGAFVGRSLFILWATTLEISTRHGS